ncbi:hypothetical protein [Deinococcus maricopensis]|uniref:Uncharacterized protein n=1 Tax=Deinococcus maricopensis (strain DSM 21211 / LMG 22137 / NRRL B-23946 / LB-34) TaxID=709986 RepID=E8U397_DEIML|nr:hypothetical protein [Deinococcus maricopensis]ADV66042.1 hypothetical protein Deima_0382 [Deinococcus maricopensis DSM 21211]
MTRQRNFALGLAALTLSLAACSQTPAAPAQSSDLVSFTLTAPLSAVRTQGLPLDDQGAPVINTVDVRVYDASGQPVLFNGQNVYQSGGAQQTLTLTRETPKTSVLLPRGTYTFESSGLATGGEFLAYGKTALQDITATPAVNVTLHTLAEEDAATFSSKLPASAAFTRDEFDLRLAVRSPSANNAHHSVPLSDYTVSYDVVNDQGTPDATLGELLVSSKLGARARALGTVDAQNLNVRATVRAWVATGEHTAEQMTFTKTFTLPFSATAMQADFEAPTLTLDAVNAQAGRPTQLRGTASDNASIASVRVYDGARLIGSTDDADATADTEVFPVLFDGSSWTLDYAPDAAGEHDYTVIAADPSGNERRAETTATLTSANLLPVLRPTPGFDGQVNFNVTSGSDTWYLLDLRAMNPNFWFDSHNNWGDGWGYAQRTYHATLHRNADIALPTSVNDDGWHSISYGTQNATNRLYFWHVTGTSTGNVIIEAYN